MKKPDCPISEKLMYLIDDNRDFALCDEMYMYILDKYDDDFISDDTNRHEETVILIIHVSGIIDNGGFKYLYEGNFDIDPYYNRTYEAFLRIDALNAANALEESLSIFPDNKPPLDDKLREGLFNSISEKDEEELSSKFWAESDNIERLLAKYIRDNKEKFGYKPSPERMKRILDKRERRKRPQNEILTLINNDDQNKLKAIIETKPELINQKGGFEVKDFCGQLVNKSILPIELAIYNNNLEIVDLLVKAGAQINEKCMDGHSLLTNCCRNDKQDILELLLKYSAGTEIMNTFKITPLLSASKNDQLECAKLLVESGADIKHRAKSGDNCLYNLRNVDLARLLVENGAELNNLNNENETPLHIAVINEFIDLAKYFISVGAKIDIKNEEGQTPVDIAKENGTYTQIFSN